MEAATPSKAAEADIRSDNRVWRRVKENGNLFWAFRDPAQPQDNGNGSEPCLVSLPVDILLDMISLLDFASVNSLGLVSTSPQSRPFESTRSVAYQSSNVLANNNCPLDV